MLEYTDISNTKLCDKCPDMELFRVRIFLYLDWTRGFAVRIQGKATKKSPVFKHFSRSAIC